MSAELTPRRRALHVRVLAISCFPLLLAGFVLYRAFDLQVLRADELEQQARRHYLRKLRFSPKRGTIRDRHGAELAVSVDTDSVFADLQLFRKHDGDPQQAAVALSRLLGVDEKVLERRFASDRDFIWVKRRVTPKAALAVSQLGVPGVAIQPEAKRYYPNVQLAAHILGFADIDGKGIEGLERNLDERLRGVQASSPAVHDRKGRVVYSKQLLDGRSAEGDEVTLTLDKTLQHIAEKELELAVGTFEARAGSLVVLDPSSGELLAVANYPTFNPNDPGSSPVGHRRNRAVTDRFEPGSTVKPFTVAGALSAGALRPHEEVECEDGSWRVGTEVVHDTHRWSTLTPSEILAYSSNIGTAKIALALGRPGLYRTLRNFGFGEATGVPLPGETAGKLRDHSLWYDMDAATISFGQGMSVTALQLTVAMAGLANGGKLMQPLLVKRIRDARGDLVQEASPQVRRRVVPARVARLVSDMLTGVTEPGGTGVEAAIDGYLVAGKTGTAQKADYVHGGYAKGRWSSSFVGYAPAHAPRLVIAVVIDEPVIAHSGGQVAAPAFRRVMEQSLRHLGVPTDHQVGNLSAHLIPSQKDEQEQAPAELPEAVAVTEPPTPGEDAKVAVPSFEGMTARSAVAVALRSGLKARLYGSGLVVSQDPGPQARRVPDSVVHLHLALPKNEELPVEGLTEIEEVATTGSEPPEQSAAGVILASANGGEP